MLRRAFGVWLGAWVGRVAAVALLPLRFDESRRTNVDNRKEIIAKGWEIQGEVIAVNAAASLYHQDQARAHVLLMRAKLDEMDVLINNLSFEDTGILQFKPYPSPMEFAYNSPVSYQFEAAGGVAPYKFSWSGITPFGVTLSEDGLMSGTMLQSPNDGGYVVFLMITDSASPDLGVTSAALWLKVTP